MLLRTQQIIATLLTKKKVLEIKSIPTFVTPCCRSDAVKNKSQAMVAKKEESCDKSQVLVSPGLLGLEEGTQTDRWSHCPVGLTKLRSYRFIEMPPPSLKIKAEALEERCQCLPKVSLPWVPPCTHTYSHRRASIPTSQQAHTVTHRKSDYSLFTDCQ